jgi:hypothetical protein
MFGPLDKPENKTVKDIHGRETWVFGIIVAAALVMGVWPQPILARSEKSVAAFVASYRERLAEARRDVDAPAHIFPALPSTAPSGAAATAPSGAAATAPSGAAATAPSGAAATAPSVAPAAPAGTAPAPAGTAPLPAAPPAPSGGTP